MSASLVGSEMCIRDRRAGMRAECRLGQLCELARVNAELRTPRTGTSTSVSYTHLTLPTICSV
eukprot:3607603-Alexandrium_andersonii.AAC.1